MRAEVRKYWGEENNQQRTHVQRVDRGECEEKSGESGRISCTGVLHLLPLHSSLLALPFFVRQGFPVYSTSEYHEVPLFRRE